MATEQQILSAIANISATIPGIGVSYAEPPPTLAGANLPAAFAFPGPATYERVGDGGGDSVLMQCDRRYILRVYVELAGAGVPGEAFADVVPMITATKNAFLGRTNLGLNGVLLIGVPQDTGAQVLSWAGQSYYGLELTLVVRTYEKYNHPLEE